MKVKRAISMFLAGALCVLSVIIPSPNANAADITISKPTTTDDNTVVPIRRKIKNLSVGTTVNAVFTYEIIPSNENPAGALNEPTSVQISFSDVQAAQEPDSSMVTAEAYGVVDFDGVTYTTPGDYFYNIIESESSNPNYAVDEVSSYNLMVSIRNEMETIDGVEHATGNLTATVLQTVENVNTGEKDVEALFGTQEATRVMFHIMTGVGGNAGDLDNCFKYKLDIMESAGLTNGTILDIAYDDAGVSRCDATPEVVTVGNTAYIYLKHHQQAFVGYDQFSEMFELPIGTKYSVTNEGDDEYAVSLNKQYGGSGEIINFEEGDIRTSGTIEITTATSDQGVMFSHTKTMGVLTGVSLKSLPYIIGGIISAVGIFLATRGFINVKAKRN